MYRDKGENMKTKKILFLLLTILVAVGLTACANKKVNPKEATEVLINSMVYQKNEDIAKYKEVFNEDAAKSKKQAEDVFVESVSSSLSTMGIIEGNNEKEIKELWNVMMNQVKEKTSYTVEVVKEDKTNPELEVKIKGLDSDKLMQEFQNKMTAEVQKDPEIAKDKLKLGKLFLVTFKTVVQGAVASENEVTIPVKLEPNKDDKSKWQIIDKNQTTTKISTAFFDGR